MNEKEILTKLDNVISIVEAKAAKDPYGWKQDQKLLTQVFDGVAKHFENQRTISSLPHAQKNRAQQLTRKI